MEVMQKTKKNQALQGDLRIDNTYLGGERTGEKVGRGSENKVAFAAAVEMHEGRPQRVRFDLVAAFSYARLADWAKRALGCHTSPRMVCLDLACCHSWATSTML